MLTLIIFIVLMFLFNTHPLIIRFILILFRLVYGFILAISAPTTWIRYILIIVFLRGIMIIILYITRLSSNENIKINIKTLIISLLLIIPASVLIFLIPVDKNPLNNIILHYFRSNTFELVYKTYRRVLSDLTVILIIYLLIVLIVAVKIISLGRGPLKINK